MSNYVAMRNPDNHSQVTLIKVETTDLQKEADRIRKKAQYHGECACPKKYIWKCDGDCDHCDYCVREQPLSLDLEIENHGDCFCDSTDTEEVITDKLFFSELLARLAVLMPEAIEVGKLMLNGESERSSIEKLGMTRSTYRSRLNKIKQQLFDEYGKIF